MHVMNTAVFVLFGSGTISTLCIASIDISTESIIYQGKEHRTYNLNAGIKHALPLSLLIFLFYINDIFQFFDAIYHNCASVLDKINILIHADDATLISTTRAIAIAKAKSLLFYCNLNTIIPQ